jgi:CheY-like chemotaxis protein
MILKGKTIFIVEDNATNRVVFEMALIRHGAVVDFERWGAATVARLANMPRVDLIILDLMLADGISGFDLFDQIRQLPQYNAVPVIAVSAMDPAIAIPKAQAKGFAGFIVKPIERSLFPYQIADLIHGKTIWYRGQQDISV